MATCPNCAAENPERARFCLECGSPLTATGGSAGGARKLVTILFADVVGSTALGERLDPETLRSLLTRYFAAARRVLERHGGTVEKFIGDAVMAVFGIPMLHEDDALRGVRAAVELRDAISELNDQLSAERGLRIEFRIGVNSGEVVAGGRDGNGSLVTGDAVNVAARLEQNASPSEILIGETTYRLTRDYVQAEQVQPIPAKGKSESVTAYRLLGMADSEAGPRRAGVPFIGRKRELSRLMEAFEDAGNERRCHLFTLLGTAGVGKSRLVAEFTAGVGSGATVVHGRCLPYGDGITFWPIAEIVRTMVEAQESEAADELIARLVGLLAEESEGPRIAQLVAGAVGLVAEAVTAEETSWAIRRFLEAQARRKPLVCVIEDLHWAEPTLLDVLEQVADWTRDAPILLLCTARPEFLELRPTWGGGKVNATTLLLEPLSAEQTQEFVSSLLRDQALRPNVVARILETAEGNPLFAEEIVRMLVEQGEEVVSASSASDSAMERVALPTSIQAVIAARLDLLPARERLVAERASVAGRVFERGAVIALVPADDRATVADDLRALVRKELVHPDRAELTTDEAFRFRHLLIRDTAYEALPKQERATLHERFAEWVEGVVGERIGEFAEIVGYHYEQALRYRSDLGIADEDSESLAARAAAHLVDAGTRAYGRRDHAAAAKLLSRAVALMPAGRERRAARVTLAVSHLETYAHDLARPVIGALLAEAQAAGDEVMVWKAKLLEQATLSWSDPTTRLDTAEGLVEKALPIFEAAGDDYGLMLAYRGRAEVHLGRAHWERAMAAYALAIPHAARSDQVLEESIRADFIAAALWGPTPVPELLRTAEREMSSMHSVHAPGLGIVALARALGGDRERAIADIRDAVARRVEVVGAERAVVFTSGWVEYVLGDLDAAAAAFKRSSAAFAASGETGARSTTEGLLAVTLFDLGRSDEEVLAAAERCRALSAEDDAVSQVLWREATALVAARAGHVDEARRLISDAIQLADQTDFLHLRGLNQRDRARIARMAGDFDTAREAYERALDYFERKGDVVDAERTRDALAELGKPV